MPASATGATRPTVLAACAGSTCLRLTTAAAIATLTAQ
jgi:hypothetical protein